MNEKGTPETPLFEQEGFCETDTLQIVKGASL